MRLKQTSTFVAAPGGLLLILFFFFLQFQPAIRLTSAAAQTLIERPDNKLTLLPLIGLLAVLLAGIGYFRTRLLTPRTALLIYVIPSMIGIGLMIARYLQLRRDLNDLGTRLPNNDWQLSIQYQPGWWFSMAALLLIFAAGVMIYLTEDQPVSRPAAPPRPLSPDEMKKLMLEARELIIAKRYREARAILRRVDHPTAKTWLQKLDQIAPES